MKPHILINNQKIYWSFIQSVKTIFGKNDDMMIDAFWKARNQPNIAAYIKKGLIPDLKNRRYMIYPSRERENGEMEQIREWWYGLYQKKMPTTMKQTLKETLRDLAEKL
jgi:hypothetical protein